MSCIFGSPNLWASVQEMAKQKFDKIAAYEKEFGVTIHRTRSITEQAEKGEPYSGILTRVVKTAMSKEYTLPIVPDGDWTLPLGAYGESAGPT